MKTFKLLVPVIILSLYACEKKEQSVTRPVEFTDTKYENLGSFDASGRPDGMTKDIVSTNLQSYITTTLPENADVRSSHPELLASTAIADIAITQSSDVHLTFVSQGTALTDAIAFYTYPTSQPLASPKDIKKITYIFPNAGGGSTLQAGDKVKLGRFDPGVSIGFVLLQSAWNAASKTLNDKAVHFCSNDVLNPEIAANLKKHALLIPYPQENKVLIGFEDVNRTEPSCDHDFNDVVMYASVTP